MALVKQSLVLVISAVVAHGYSLPDAFTGYNGKPVPPEEAIKAWKFNQRAAAGEFDHLNYRQYRKTMNDHGLSGKNWHVGHIEPNVKGTPRMGPGAGPEDMGSNLFAQPAHDNLKLGRRKATQAELEWMGRLEKSGQKTAVKVTEKAAVKGTEKAAVKAGEKAAVKAGEKTAVKGTEKAAVKGTEKAAVKAAEKAAVKAGEKAAVKAGEKAAVKVGQRAAVKGLEKVGAKSVGGALGKLAPGVGVAVAAAFAADRHKDGHHGQAALEWASGVASTVPGVGTVASVALDGINAVFDAFGVNF